MKLNTEMGGNEIKEREIGEGIVGEEERGLVVARREGEKWNEKESEIQRVGGCTVVESWGREREA